MRKSYLWAIVAAFIVLGVIRIASTYTHFSFVFDERAHLLTGMEWLDRGTYKFETLHPPLSRIAGALPLYLDGLRLDPNIKAKDCPHSFVEEYREVEEKIEKGFFKSYCLMKGSSKFLIKGDLKRTLVLSRGAMAVFFVIASIYVFLLGSIWLGRAGGIASLFLFTMTPVVLGVSSFVLTDMAFTAMFLGALHALIRFLDEPNWKYALYVGVMVALATVSKFSALMFIPLAYGVLLLFRAWQIKGWPLPRWQLIAGSILVCFMVVWSFYRFSIGTAAEVFPVAETLSHQDGTLAELAGSRLLPMPEFFQGILSVMQKDEKGHGSLLFGKLDDDGVWYFFPTQLPLRTPIPVMLLFAAGAVFIVRDAIQKRSFTPLVPLVLFSLMMVVMIPARINVGLRHIIHFYGPLSIIAGYTLVRFWDMRKKWRIFTVLGVTSVVLASVMAHPYYYNDYWKILDPKPERFINMPDLDFGQDRQRVTDFVNENDIAEITVCSWKTEVYSHYTEKEIIQKCPPKKPAGWFAISIGRQTNTITIKRLGWLENEKPVTRLGTSLDIYYFPPEEEKVQ